jgi:hypothetical protein
MLLPILMGYITMENMPKTEPELNLTPFYWKISTSTAGVKRPGSELTMHLRLVPRLRFSGAIPPPS